VQNIIIFVWQILLVHYEVYHSIISNMQQKWDALLGAAKVFFWNYFLNLSGTTLLSLKKQWALQNLKNSLFSFSRSWLGGIAQWIVTACEYNFCCFVKITIMTNVRHNGMFWIKRQIINNKWSMKIKDAWMYIVNTWDTVILKIDKYS
jgi:hypothetical protein